MSLLPLRPYQRSDIDDVTAAWSAGTNRPAVVAATGLGKTVEFATLAAEHIMRNPSHRVLVLVHREELATQARNKVHSIAPHLRPGRVQGASHNDTSSQVIIGSVPTLRNLKRREQIHGVGLVIADECHHAAAESWVDVMTHFGCYSGLPTAGFTATMVRAAGGLGDVWQAVVNNNGKGRDMLWGIRHNYLCDVRGKRVQVPDLELTKRMGTGSGTNDAAGTAMVNADAGPHIVKALTEFAPNRRPIIFAPNVASATDFHEHLLGSGDPFGLILGTTTSRDRRRIFDGFKAGDIRGYVNAMVLTEGFDEPELDCAVIARPTQSGALYQQMIGRVLRPFPGKDDALVLDVVGVTSSHDLSTLLDLGPYPDKQDETQSLREMWDDDEATGGGGQQVDLLGSSAPIDGPVVGTDVDLLASSKTVWLRTYGGIWFIPAGSTDGEKVWFFLWPERSPTGQLTGTVTVGWTPAVKWDRATSIVGGSTLEIGMAWAEKYAAEYDSNLAGKSANWRRRGQMTLAQGHKFRRLGIVPYGLDPELNQGQASDKIEVHMASKRFDS
jgi:superfamily II DNA or RNA helicase